MNERNLRLHGFGVLPVTVRCRYWGELLGENLISYIILAVEREGIRATSILQIQRYGLLEEPRAWQTRHFENDRPCRAWRPI